MKSSHDTLCFTCKQAISDPPVLNQVSEDEVCPACAERVLASLPPALPSSRRGADQEKWSWASEREESFEFDLPSSGFDPNDLPPEPA